jgi:hypothetical protein
LFQGAGPGTDIYDTGFVKGVLQWKFRLARKENPNAPGFAPFHKSTKAGDFSQGAEAAPRNPSEPRQVSCQIAQLATSLVATSSGLDG